MKEITHSRIITIAVHDLIFKVCFVMFEFVFYIGKLGIEFVFFGIFGLVQVFVLGNFGHG